MRRRLTRRILCAGEVLEASFPAIFSKIISGGVDCFNEILCSVPDLPGSVDWDRAETLGKVRASREDVITKAKYSTEGIIYSKSGQFPHLDKSGNPPLGLEWQKSSHHGLVINSQTQLIKAVEEVVGAHSVEDKTFQAANRVVQGKAPKERLSAAVVWTAKTALFLIRLFATAIG